MTEKKKTIKKATPKPAVKATTKKPAVAKKKAAIKKQTAPAKPAETAQPDISAIPVPMPAATMSHETAPASAPAVGGKKRWGVWVMIAIATLVGLEVSMVLKNKAVRDKKIVQVGVFGKRGNGVEPEYFKGTLIGKIDNQDRYLLVDESLNKVIVTNVRDGVFQFILVKESIVPQPAEFLPRDVAVDSKGQIFVLDFAGRKIHAFSAQGGYLRSWESPNAYALAVDNQDHILAADNQQRMIRQYDDKGNEISQIGRKGPHKGRLENPGRMATDDQGNLYVLDQNRKALLVYQTNGKWKKTLALDFDDFQNAAVSVRNGKIYINNFSGNAILVFTLDGKLAAQIKEQYPGSIAVDSQDNLYLPVGNGIGKFEIQ